MGAAPVHPGALRALGEHVVRLLGAVFEQSAHGVLRGPGQCAVARGAAGPGGQGRSEAAEDVAELLLGAVAVDVRPRPDLAAAQQPAVPGEQDAPLPCREGGEGGVADVLALVRRVDAKEPQPAGQRAEMDVEEEPQGRAGDLLGAFHGADVDVFAGARHM